MRIGTRGNIGVFGKRSYHSKNVPFIATSYFTSRELYLRYGTCGYMQGLYFMACTDCAKLVHQISLAKNSIVKLSCKTSSSAQNKLIFQSKTNKKFCCEKSWSLTCIDRNDHLDLRVTGFILKKIASHKNTIGIYEKFPNSDEFRPMPPLQN